MINRDILRCRLEAMSADDIRQALGQLGVSARDASVMVARYCSGCSWEQIGDRLGISSATVRKIDQKILRKWARDLGKREEV